MIYWSLNVFSLIKNLLQKLLISLEREMAVQSSILAWEIPWTEEPGGPQSMGSKKKIREFLSVFPLYISIFINSSRILC